MPGASVRCSRVVDADDPDLLAVVSRLRGVLELACGKLRAGDALMLAGFERTSWVRAVLVGQAMRQLGWERRRCRFDGATVYAFVRGSSLQREVILEVARSDDGQPILKRREP